MQICIIGGFPRAGTRQFTDILNVHPEIAIKGEVYRKSFRLAGDLFAQADKDHHGNWSDKTHQRIRELAALDVVAAISKGNTGSFSPDTVVRGFKSPRIETQKATLDLLFGLGRRKIVFFYCVRNVVANYLSVNAMWGSGFERWKSQTLKSLRAFGKMQHDRKYAVTVLQFDVFAGTEDKGPWIKRELFDRIACTPVSEADCRDYLARTSNRNATLRKTGAARPGALLPEDRQRFVESKDLRSAVAQFAKATGIDLWRLDETGGT